MKNQSKLITFLFVGFISLFFVLGIFMPKREFSEMENRTLAQFPSFSFKSFFSGEYTADIGKYLTDQFPFRDEWVGLKYFSERALLKTENNGVFFGKDGALYDVFETPDPELLEKNFQSVESFAENAGIPVSFSLIPSSAYVYKENLPDNAVCFDQQTMLNRAENINGYFDLSQPLLDAKDGYIYYRTDHHWTSDGAYEAYKAICEDMGLNPYERVFRKSYEDFYGTLYSNSGARLIESDTVDTYETADITVYDAEGKEMSFYDDSYADRKDKYSVFLGGNHGLLKIVNGENKDGEKLLLIKDSYSNSLLPYLTHNFSEIHVYDLRFNKTSVAKYIEENGIDRALVLYSCDNFASDTNIFLVNR